MDESVEDTAKKQSELVKNWLSELSGARKREKTWRKDAKAAVRLYEAESQADNAFNILYTNTETLAPALYNSVPRPVVERRFKDEDPMGLLASRVVQRTLEYLLDTDLYDYTSFDEGMQSSVLESLVPGRGLCRVKYEAHLTRKPLTIEGPEEELSEGEPREAQEGETPTYEAVEGETVCLEEVPWDRFLHGYAKKWKDVPWVAFEHVMTKDELKDNFGDVAVHVQMAEALEDSDENEGNSEDAKQRATSETKYISVYEVWSKRDKKVIFVSPGYSDAPLKSVEDPLALSGFFPCPRPLNLMRRVSSLLPNTLYKQYEQQAKELNRITIRINKIVSALKVRGMYDATVEGLDKVLEAEDNILIPAQNVAALQQGQTLDKAIFLMPIEKLVAVLQQLYNQREQVKRVIHEITGIADIMRGSSVASETLGAQKIKDQWGTLRLKKAQREVQRYARDLLRLLGEVAVTKLSPETLAKMTSIPIPTAEEKQQAIQMVQQIQSQTPPPQPQMPGQPPQPQPPAPQIPPQVQAATQSPTWDDVLMLLQDDVQRSFRIDIETNSTVDLEATEDKQNAGEVMNAMAQFFNGVGPLVQNGTLPFEAAKAILLGLIRKYRFGGDIEEQLKTMKQPPPPIDPKAEAAKNSGPSPEELQAQKAEGALKLQLASQQGEFARQEHAFNMQELERKGQLAAEKFAMDMAKIRAKPIKPAGITTA